MFPNSIDSGHGTFYLATASEEIGADESLGVALYLKVPERLSNSKFKDLSFYREADAILEKTRRFLQETDPDKIRQRQDHFFMLKELFTRAETGPIFAKEIPNEYCGKACCITKPWAIVTTPKGHFKIGWRKRVINIDWTESIVGGSGEELFPDEEVTKSSKYEQSRLIHAWGWDKAVEYLKRLHA